MHKKEEKKSHPYTVVWQEEDKAPLQGGHPKKEEIPRPDKLEHKPRAGTETEPHDDGSMPIWLIVALVLVMVLAYLYFTNTMYFLIACGILAVFYAGFAFTRQRNRAYVDSMSEQVILLKLDHPMRTGFQFAMGVGMFAGLCILLGLIIMIIAAATIGYAAFSVISQYLPI